MWEGGRAAAGAAAGAVGALCCLLGLLLHCVLPASPPGLVSSLAAREGWLSLPLLIHNGSGGGLCTVPGWRWWALRTAACAETNEAAPALLRADRMRRRARTNSTAWTLLLDSILLFNISTSKPRLLNKATHSSRQPIERSISPAAIAVSDELAFAPCFRRIPSLSRPPTLLKSFNMPKKNEFVGGKSVKRRKDEVSMRVRRVVSPSQSLRSEQDFQPCATTSRGFPAPHKRANRRVHVI